MEFDHNHDHVLNYSRTLKLKTGISSVEYGHNGVKLKREVIASFPQDVLALRLIASLKIKADIGMTRLSESEFETNELLDTLEILFLVQHTAIAVFQLLRNIPVEESNKTSDAVDQQPVDQVAVVLQVCLLDGIICTVQGDDAASGETEAVGFDAELLHELNISLSEIV